MTSPRLSVLKRQLKIPASTPAAPPAPVDLAAAIEALVAQEVAKALGNTPPRPASGSRLRDLERRLALVQPVPVTAPVRDLRDIFDMPPAVPATPPAGVPSAEPIAEVLPAGQPSGRTEIRTVQRDHNGFLQILQVNTEAGAHTVTVQQRDPRNRIALIDLGDGRRLSVRHDDLREVIVMEPAAD